MTSDREPILSLRFSGVLIEWRGPSPFHFVSLPEDVIGEIRYAARIASYGWGVVPVTAENDEITFTTSLFPRDGGYLLPVKDKVRKPLGLVPGDAVVAEVAIYDRA